MPGGTGGIMEMRQFARVSLWSGRLQWAVQLWQLWCCVLSPCAVKPYSGPYHADASAGCFSVDQRSLFYEDPAITWKSTLAFLAYLGVIFFADYWEPLYYYRPLPGMVVNVVVLVIVCWWSAGFRRIRKGTDVIAAGNVNHKIDTTRLPGELKRHAESLNNISSGLNSAVDEKMKSERFKAELITNVSHDLKTPLTSIINYVNLLKSTQQTDPKAQEYIEVLDRKSQRLKKLTEDLVEASKASTGACP